MVYWRFNICVCIILGISIVLLSVFIAYRVYSKCKAQEKNPKMSTYAIFLSALSLVSASFNLANILDPFSTLNLFPWISEISAFAFHFLFTTSYLSTALRLPLVLKLREIYNELQQVVFANR